jgi:hypothetical protein
MGIALGMSYSVNWLRSTKTGTYATLQLEYLLPKNVILLSPAMSLNLRYAHSKQILNTTTIYQVPK